ncbi:helix-turn-helix domain-containing protein [Conexibacter arvalis]|uniref:helix-turn-helix domain-containing protein n=1 Tax=Conexibacter arvalis TaxID=912552 RepID=UPI00161A2C7A
MGRGADRRAGPTTDRLVASVGERLRSERERQGLSLRELAKRIGLSPSAVSQIERGQVMPSVGTLYTLTSELGLSMDDVFAQTSESGEHPALVRLDAVVQDGERPAAAATLAAPTGRVFPRAERGVITLASGVRWELLTGYEPGTEFLHVTYPVGSQSCEPDQLIRHEGTERGVVLSGRLGVTLGDEHHELRAGDSISFSSDVPHRLWAIGEQPAEAIWFITGRNGAG